MNNQNEFKPYIPAEKVTPEFTVTSIVMGIILSVVFGAANAYLGPFLRCRHFFCGRQKEEWRSRVCCLLH